MKTTTALLITAYVLFSAITAFSKEAKHHNIPIFSVNTPEKVVSLTFNAAWDDADTEKILEILEKYGIKASFFLCGKFVKSHPELLLKIRDGGHDVCNHGDTHAHVASLNLADNKREIAALHEKVKNIANIKMNLYRGPYGEYNSTVVEAAESLGYTMIQWDIDSVDWMNKGAEHLVDRVLNSKKLKNGSIILFHTDAKYTASALERVIQGLIDKGCGFVPVSELIYKENYYIDIEGRQHQKPGI